ncbi:MAG TPA: hypothetical protein VFW93_13750 [Aquabacterium sp.]|uniref:hypothetical protein n=1 Tax=Aquabacterium sp. TaxID=1872578 RepID=UPI002E375EB9|nr:hypothetical protein [Aquabacterium sp.]HEX5357278.1 hypothetical protein [Aquabacterium sp.]
MMVRTLKRLGLAGGMGISLLVGAAWVYLAWLPAQQEAVDKLGSQARRMRHELQAASGGAQQRERSADVRSPEAAWDALWHGLPVADQRVPLQAAVLAAARDNEVMVSSVQYQGRRAPWSAREGAVLWRQRMVMPVSGSYPALKAWMAQMLKEPALTIDEVAMQRSDPALDQLQARVTVSLWWRKPEKAQP